MRRSLLWPACLVLALVACSESGAPTTTEETTGTTVAENTTSVSPTSSQPQSTTPPTTADPGRPAAPDFTLDLGEGGTYTLSEGAKPVYLVFWAEW